MPFPPQYQNLTITRIHRVTLLPFTDGDWRQGGGGEAEALLRSRPDCSLSHQRQTPITGPQSHLLGGNAREDARPF
eukprot:4322788-Pyramimonas_sp.AAC.1